MPPEFVVYLPVRNGGHHVDLAIGSVLAQSHARWRLVILENASTDGTPERLARWDDPRISIVPADRPLSMYENWHRAHDLMGQEDPATLVTILGHDDVFHPDFLTDIAGLVRDHPDASLYHTLFDMIDENDGRIRPCRPVPERESWMSMLGSMLWYLRDSFGTGYVFRAGDYRRVGGIPDLPMLLFSDWLVFVRLARLSYKVSTLSNRFSYRRHLASTSGTPSREKHAAHLVGMWHFIRLVRTEFAEFATTDAGRAGIAALLARELSLLTVPIIRRNFSAENRVKLDELLAIYDEAADGVPASTLVGQPYRPARVFVTIRRFNAAQEYLRYHWWGRFRR
ncbi:glycosyltransferase [Sphingomonas sp. KR1UV-12]|uniref:Glycosyltransferase n=1 Tax=Sphingomonas aurea TaxID=3063994 RepID=A0ABT9EP93_9SPHN|nr:glycosyltransferase [Sphingomonas sp. KR1UV-12]MDP1028789.1 glycosyltransferase [Sphingomonas sp. KR1UV-12]